MEHSEDFEGDFVWCLIFCGLVEGVKDVLVKGPVKGLVNTVVRIAVSFWVVGAFIWSDIFFCLVVVCCGCSGRLSSLGQLAYICGWVGTWRTGHFSR